MMLKALAFVLLCGLAAAYTEEEGVIVATDATFDAIIAEFEFALVEFYAPWCGHCKSLAPEYVKAAKELETAKSAVKLVKVDATVETALAEKFEISGFPTLKWFRKGKATEYTGGRMAGDIVTWVKKKSGPACVPVGTPEAATKLAAENEVVVLGLFESDKAAQVAAFTETAETVEQVFAISYDAKVAAAYGVQIPAIVLLKQFDEGKNVFAGEYTVKDISEFVQSNSLPLVIEFTDASASKIFGGNIKSHLLLFVDKASAEFTSLKTTLTKVAAKSKGKVLFIYLDASVDDNQRILEFFGMTAADVPGVRLINIDGEMAKYKPAFKTITEDALGAWVEDYKAGKLKQSFLTQDTPADWDAKPVKVLTGGNFAQVALDSTKVAFVEFYAPWCGHCKSLAPVWDRLGEAFAKEANVVIAKLDSTANELEEVKVQSFPTLKLFPAGADAKAIDYDGPRTLSGFVAFVNQHAGTNVQVSDADRAADAAAEDDSEDHYAQERHDEF